MSAAPLILQPSQRLGRSQPDHNAETVLMQRSMLSPSRLHSEAIQFRIIFGATYPFFLAAVLARRVLPGPSPAHAGFAPAPRSVFAEAKAMAVSAIPFVFMG